MEAAMEKKNMEIQAINHQTIGQRLKSYKRSPLSLVLLLLVSVSALLTVLTLLFLIAYILIKGIPYLTPSLFAWEYTTENVSLMPALVNTVVMTGLSLLIAVPLGIFAAIYLVEYAKRGNRLVSIVRITAETLTGIPSIVYGLFGFLLFAVALGWSYTILGGAMTLAIMILPTIMRTTEEALKAVPDSYREGSFGLGAGRLRTVFHSAWNSGRYHSGSRPYCRRDRGTDVYSGNRCRYSIQPIRLRPYSGSTHVCADQ